MKILVTGGSGFIGSRLVKRLIMDGHHVVVLSRDKSSKLECGGECVQVTQFDLLDGDLSLDEIVSGCSLVFNCAGELKNKSVMEALHVGGTVRLIAAIKKTAKTNGRPVHFVQLSSVGAYGRSKNSRAPRIVTEKTALNPIGLYEISKTQADELIAEAAEDGVFSYSILRPSNVYGAGMPNGSIRQWASMIEKNLFFYVGPPGAISTYVHVDDVVEALVLCGLNETARNEIFNISNDCSQEILVEAMARELGVPTPRRRLPEWPLRLIARALSGIPGMPISSSRVDALVARTRYPTDKLDLLLNFIPRRSVNETIAEALKKTGDAC